jgi:dTDP-4-dehydrorhamnose reductase
VWPLRYTMNIVITGSSGFLGQHLIHSLLTEPPPEGCSYRIHALFHSMQGFEDTIASLPTVNGVSIQAYKLDLTDEDSITEWIKKVPQIDVCIHTAALSSPRDCQEAPERATKLNVPQFFFDQLARKGVRMIALSTDQVYAGTNAPYAETDPLEPCNVYGLSKVEMEKYITKAFKSAVLLRSSIILGPKAPLLPDQAHGTFLHFIESRKGVDTTFFTDECRSVVASHDVVQVIKYLLHDDSKHGIINMGGPARVSRLDMARAVFDHLGYDPVHLKADTKASQPPGPVASPLDISMKIDRIREWTNIEFQGLEEIVKTTF